MAEGDGGTTVEEKQKTEGDGGSANDEKVVQLNESQLQAAIDKAIAEGKQQGATETYDKFKSQADRQVAEVRKASSTVEEENANLRQRLFERMTPEEQDRERLARIEEQLSRRGESASTSPANPSSTGVPSEATAGQQDVDAVTQQVRNETEKILKEAGVDPEKVNIGGDLGSFLKGIVKEAEANAIAKQAKEQNDEDEDAKRNGFDSKQNGGGKVIDLRNTDPMDLIKRGAAKRLQA